ncbi:MAG TPA: hypothetical protein VD963_07755, partial [Phycisphaerales bacterium]|nr:hypothetical protein [Phycisphaerales bacterium]
EWDYVTVKYHATTGQALWTRRYNGPGNWSDMPQALEVDAAGNCYIAGFAFFQPDLLSRYATDFHVIKYTSAGAIAWQYNTNTGATGNLGAGARDIALDPSGNVYATGVIQGGDQWNTNNDFLTVKLTNDGELVYRRTYSSPGFNTGMDDGKVITADAAGNAYVAGYWMPGEATERHLDTRTIKYSPAGELLWTASTDRPREEGAQGIAVDAQGNVFVAGGWLAATENNGFLNAYGPTGTPLWDYVLDEPGDWDENWFVDVKVGPDGNVWAGADNQRETGYDPTLVKFSPSGEVLLRESYDAGSNSDSTFAFDVDELGNAYFGGHSYFPATSSDLLTLKVPGTLPPPTCPADFDTSGQVNTSDISAFLSEWFVDVAGTGLASDFNADGVANTADVSAFLSAWFAALSGGCR